MKLKIVEFKNGKFGVQRGRIFKYYLDLSGINNDITMWWSLRDRWIRDCKGSYEEAFRHYDRLKQSTFAHKFFSREGNVKEVKK